MTSIGERQYRVPSISFKLPETEEINEKNRQDFSAFASPAIRPIQIVTSTAMIVTSTA